MFGFALCLMMFGFINIGIGIQLDAFYGIMGCVMVIIATVMLVAIQFIWDEQNRKMAKHFK